MTSEMTRMASSNVASDAASVLSDAAAQAQDIRDCLQAVRIAPQSADACYALGNAYRRANQLESALDAYGKALQLNRGHYKTYSALADMLVQLGRYPEALKYYSLALQTTPTPLENVDNLFRLGELYKRMRSFDQAIECYRYVLQLQPEHERALIGLSQIYRQQGKTEEAIQLYDRMLSFKQDDPGILISKALSLPIVYQSLQEIEDWRNRVSKQIDALLEKKWNTKQSLALHGSTFYLGYQAKNDRELVERIGRVFQEILPTYEIANQKSHAKPRIGIVSRYLGGGHTIIKFMQGMIENLSRDQFQVMTFSIGRDHCFLPLGKANPEDRHLILPTDDIEKAAALIRKQQPDILLYADIGMNITSYCLAAMRLAPVQCVTWGHPVTTGLNTIDYFLSSRLIEPNEAQAHYTEQLVLLENLPTYYYCPPTEGITADRAAFGLETSDHLYLCPQSLFKLHPDFDAIIRGILERDPQGKVILLSHYSDAVNQLLLKRFQHNMPEGVVERIRFLPRLGQDQFMHLLACADVMLDPLHFGGGNTTYEALALGVPIVHWPGEFMRGRVTTGCYQKMQVSDCIVHSAQAYIELAVRLGTDATERARISQRILQTHAVLYEDRAVITELEQFFLNALQGAKGAYHA
jgi:protein O-GlcNAc transferase